MSLFFCCLLEEDLSLDEYFCRRWAVLASVHATKSSPCKSLYPADRLEMVKCWGEDEEEDDVDASPAGAAEDVAAKARTASEMEGRKRAIVLLCR